MHKTIRVLASLSVLVLAAGAIAGEVESLIKEGNNAFRQEQYDSALERYQMAEAERPESPEIDYDIAGVLHKQEKYEEAVERYNKALNSQDASVNSRAQYNLGNTYFRMGEYAKAIAGYQKALEADPSDLDAKFNLELARRKLKDQLKPDEQQKQDQPKQQQDKQQDQKQQDQQQNEQKDQQQDQKKQDQQDQQQAQEQKPISKEDAERILNALKDDEEDVQKQVSRQLTGGDYSGNDW
jgi:tetratricopeptide (TPR) repeat protein